MIWPASDCHPTPANDVNIWSTDNFDGTNQASQLPSMDSIQVEGKSLPSKSLWPDSSADRPICKYFVSASCVAGDSCLYSHTALSTEASANDRSDICEICCESILKKSAKYGLLECCDHIFCLNCIREWRNQKFVQDRVNLRKCPICRLESFMIVPSARFLVGWEKQVELEQYKSHLAGLPCRNFANGTGKCQFGTSCLYSHLVDGERVEPVSDFKLISGADGKRTKKMVSLSEFIR